MTNRQLAMPATATATAIASSRLAVDQGGALGRHLAQCAAARGRWFGAARLAERVHGLVAPRIVTTVGLAAAVLTLACTSL